MERPSGPPGKPDAPTSDPPPPVAMAPERPRSSRPPAEPRSPDSNARLQAALSASSRAESSLSTLMRAMRDLSSGVSGAREANVLLVRELEGMADLLGGANERQLALKNRVAMLEQTLASEKENAANERAYILEQQDAFILALLDDHEQEVRTLRRELESTDKPPSQRPTSAPEQSNGDKWLDLDAELAEARATVERMLAERDRSRETLLKLQAQRDEAQATVAELVRERDSARLAASRITDSVRQTVPLGSAPNLRNATTLPPPESPRRPAPTTQPAPSPQPERSVRPGMTPIGITRPRAANLEPSPRDNPGRAVSPPPEELRAALHTPTRADLPAAEEPPRSLTPPGPPVVTAAEPGTTPPGPPVLTDPPGAASRSKDPGARPAGGYSLTHSVAPELVPTSHVSRAPRR